MHFSTGEVWYQESWRYPCIGRDYRNVCFTPAHILETRKICTVHLWHRLPGTLANSKHIYQPSLNTHYDAFTSQLKWGELQCVSFIRSTLCIAPAINIYTKREASDWTAYDARVPQPHCEHKTVGSAVQKVLL